MEPRPAPLPPRPFPAPAPPSGELRSLRRPAAFRDCSPPEVDNEYARSSLSLSSPLLGAPAATLAPRESDDTPDSMEADNAWRVAAGPGVVATLGAPAHAWAAAMPAATAAASSSTDAAGAGPGDWNKDRRTRESPSAPGDARCDDVRERWRTGVSSPGGEGGKDGAVAPSSDALPARASPRDAPVVPPLESDMSNDAWRLLCTPSVSSSAMLGWLRLLLLRRELPLRLWSRSRPSLVPLPLEPPLWLPLWWCNACTAAAKLVAPASSPEPWRGLSRSDRRCGDARSGLACSAAGENGDADMGVRCSCAMAGEGGSNGDMAMPAPSPSPSPSPPPRPPPMGDNPGVSITPWPVGSRLDGVMKGLSTASALPPGDDAPWRCQDCGEAAAGVAGLGRDGGPWGGGVSRMGCV